MSLRRFANSLVARLIAFGILLVVIGTVARYFILTGYIRDNLIQITSAQQSSLAEAAARNIDDKLYDRLAFLKRVAKTMPLDLVQDPAHLHDWLKERAELLPLFSLGLLVTDPNGTILADYPSVPGRVGLSLAQYADFQQVMTGRSGIGAPTVGTLTHQILIPMGVPIKDDQGNIRATLIGLTSLSTPGFLDFLGQGKHHATSDFSLVDPHHKLSIDFSGPSAMLEATPPPGGGPASRPGNKWLSGQRHDTKCQWHRGNRGDCSDRKYRLVRHRPRTHIDRAGRRRPDQILLVLALLSPHRYSPSCHRRFCDVDIAPSIPGCR